MRANWKGYTMNSPVFTSSALIDWQTMNSGPRHSTRVPPTCAFRGIQWMSCVRSHANGRVALLPDRKPAFSLGRPRASLLFSSDLLYCDAMLKEVLERGREAADSALERLLPAANQHPVSIHQAMRHSVFAGGKRLRPILCMEAGRMMAGSLPGGIDELGAALEMLHTYSLIHDDLPALDDDELRRGRPTCHVVFGEAIAILAGDALQTRAFEILSGLDTPPAATVQIIGLIANAVGTV